VYNLSTPSLAITTQIDWRASDSDKKTCHQKGKSPSDCQNYIRLLAPLDNARTLVCGTNAYQPMCREYALSPRGHYETLRQFDGTSIVPFAPAHNSTFVLVEGLLFSATVSDFRASDAMMYRKVVKAGAGGDWKDVRTHRHDHLKGRREISSIAHSPWVCRCSIRGHVRAW
jgi:semaphorin 6